MCGRYALFSWPAALERLPGYPADLQPHWNIAPGQQVLLRRRVEGVERLDRVLWGLTPPWLKDLSRVPAQARAETLVSQPFFREAFACRRGILPATGFYEWRGPRRHPYWLAGLQRPLLSLAALWEAWPAGDRVWLSAAVVTVEVAGQRRPLLLDEVGEQLWLDVASSPAALQEFMAAPPKVLLGERRLAGVGNNPAVNGPECLTPG